MAAWSLIFSVRAETRWTVLFVIGFVNHYTHPDCQIKSRDIVGCQNFKSRIIRTDVRWRKCSPLSRNIIGSHKPMYKSGFNSQSCSQRAKTPIECRVTEWRIYPVSRSVIDWSGELFGNSSFENTGKDSKPKLRVLSNKAYSTPRLILAVVPVK